MATQRYVTLRKIQHGGNDFPANTPIALDTSVAASLVEIGAIADQAGALPAMPEDVSAPLGGLVVGVAPGATPGGAAVTAEEVQEFMNAALAHAGHTGCTVAYDDAGNRFVITVTGGGSTGAPIYRKLTVTANGVTGAVLLVGHGTAGDLAQATATAAADGGTVTVAGLPASFDLTSVTANTPAGFNTATAFNLVFPCPFAIAALDDHPLATLLHFNSAAPAMLQAQTNIGVNVSAGVITLTKTGLVAGTAARWKALIQ
ncbi:hypothetical protein [Zoogloea sp.]|uniref:hypothetical protein n=1 Tax=Zoogloea sp. TaxID=49181 RepID=UPI0035B43873